MLHATLRDSVALVSCGWKCRAAALLWIDKTRHVVDVLCARELQNTLFTGTLPATACPVLNQLETCDLSGIAFECPFPANCDVQALADCGAVCITTTTTTTTTTVYECTDLLMDCDGNGVPLPLSTCSLEACADQTTLCVASDASSCALRLCRCRIL
jgi:hypothetical protein